MHRRALAKSTKETHMIAAVPVPVLSAALFQRLSSRGESDFANKLLSALRYQFGGHKEKGSS